MHIAPIPLGLTILGLALLIGPAQEAFNRFFVRDPLWFYRDPVGWRQHLKSGINGVIVRGLVGLVSLVVGILGLILF